MSELVALVRQKELLKDYVNEALRASVTEIMAQWSEKAFITMLVPNGL